MSRSGRLILGAVIAAGAVLGATQITLGSTNSTKESVFVGLVPTRLLDTRENATTFDGFDQAVGRLDADTTYELDIAGRAGVPTDALSVSANVVAVKPSNDGFITVYPCSVDQPLASTLNYQAGNNNTNEFTVPLGPYGDICIYAQQETDIVVDIYGFYTTRSGGTGTPGQDGADGQDAESPARVIWVADDGTGDFTSLSAALASITDATATKPYVIKIAPGVYTENSNVAMKNYVDVEGSGQGITTIECACSSNGFGASAAVISATGVTAEIRHLTINNTGGSNKFSFGVYTNGVTDESFSINNVTATAIVTVGGEGATSLGVYNKSSSPTMTNVTATATDGDETNGVYNYSSSSPTMTNVTATATGGTFNRGVSNDSSSSPSMNNVTATATGGAGNFGVYNSSSSPTIRNSSISGTTNSILNEGSTAQVADTALGGGNVAGGGFTCVGAYTTAFVALPGNCDND